jgi:hypothetical protein
MRHLGAEWAGFLRRYLRGGKEREGEREELAEQPQQVASGFLV